MPATQPPNRTKRVANAVMSVAQFALAAVSVPFLVLCGFDDAAEIWLVVGLGMVWIAITAFTGDRAYHAVREL